MKQIILLVQLLQTSYEPHTGAKAIAGILGPLLVIGIFSLVGGVLYTVFKKKN